MVPGYEGEPYLRFLKSGRVEVNVNSPARYLNEERYGGVTIPKTAGAKATPKWQLVAQGGEYEWHEHRIHWMSTIEPPRVKASGGKTLMKVFDWNVPLKVGAEQGEGQRHAVVDPVGADRQGRRADRCGGREGSAGQAQAEAAACGFGRDDDSGRDRDDRRGGRAAADVRVGLLVVLVRGALARARGRGARLLVAAGAYALGRRGGGDPSAPKGEVW